MKGHACRLCLIAIFLCLPVQASANAKRVWIDTDAACTPRLATDVDDCWALTLMLKDPAVDVVGISSVFGNRDHAPTVEELRALVSTISGAPPAQEVMRLVRGADGAGHGRADAKSAADAIISELEQQSLTILAFGPVTNVASVLTRRPDLTERIEAIIAVAGQRPGERFFPGESAIFHVHDMNFRKDVQAFETVLEHGAQVILVPYAAARQVVIGERELSRLQRSPGAPRRLARISRGWLAFWQRSFRADGFFPFDLIAAAKLALPGSLQCRRTRARIVHRRGLFAVRDTLEVDSGAGRDVTYCDRVRTGLLEKLLARIDGGATIIPVRNHRIAVPRPLSPAP